MDYKKSGVDIDEANKAKKSIKDIIKKTYNENVLTELGAFGSMFQLKGFKNPVLVSSVDSVGTKVKLAFLTGKHDTIGIDIVNHCVNDILVQGAKPLFFLDYLAMNKVDDKIVKEIVSGIAKACLANSLALIGGETAELPDIYHKGEYDLAGCMVGAVEKDRAVTGQGIKPGDLIIGLRSSGLHTNGYTLARKVLLKKNNEFVEEMMIPHKSYLREIESLEGIEIKGMAHITGGGLVENIPRILPEGCTAEIKVDWDIPEIFRRIQEEGDVPREDMFRTFNMGIGYVVIVSEENKEEVLGKVDGSLEIGSIVQGKRNVRMIF